MMKERMAAALSKQVNAALYSAYLYLAMSAQAHRMGIKGFAKLPLRREGEEHGWNAL